ARGAGLDRLPAEVCEHVGDQVEHRADVVALAQVAQHARLRLTDQVARDRERAEHRLDHRHVGPELARHDADRLDLVVERLRVDQRNLRPRFAVLHGGADKHGTLQAVAARLIHRPERLRETARARLEFHEIPTEPARPLHRDRGELVGRPLLFVRVAPCADRRPVGNLQPDRSLDPFPARHRVKLKLALDGHRSRGRAAAGRRGGETTEAAGQSPRRRIAPRRHRRRPVGLVHDPGLAAQPHPGGGLRADRPHALRRRMQRVAAPARRRRRRRGGARASGLDDASIRGLRARPAARGTTGLMPLTSRVVDELRRAVGRDHVITAADDLRIFERDGSIEGVAPDAVVLPANSEEVAAVMKIAARHSVPIVPRGAGTGLSGGAVTIHGGIALQVTRMRRIVEIDPVSETALVEPGVVNNELSLAAASQRLFYAPDPSSQKACTIGGNAAENSGGPHCLYYGVTTNHVLGMEVVFADGSVHWVSGDSPDRVGLDLCGVLVGSEGTLCTITKIRVRLLRVPPSIATLMAAFPTIEAASQAVSAVIGSGIVPSALEMMDSVTVGAVEAHYKAGYPTDAGAVLLVEVDGIAESTRELMVSIREIL